VAFEAFVLPFETRDSESTGMAKGRTTSHYCSILIWEMVLSEKVDVSRSFAGYLQECHRVRKELPEILFSLPFICYAFGALCQILLE
jgi:hypothetical protein